MNAEAGSLPDEGDAVEYVTGSSSRTALGLCCGALCVFRFVVPCRTGGGWLEQDADAQPEQVSPERVLHVWHRGDPAAVAALLQWQSKADRGG